MAVVADSGPLIALSRIQHIDLLPSLYGEVVIPSSVWIHLPIIRRPADCRSSIITSAVPRGVSSGWRGDRLIARIVYRLYGLTEEEIAVVERAR